MTATTTAPTGIVHIGVGNFHRAHQAAYLDALIKAGGSDEWGICGVGFLPSDAKVRDGLIRQGCRYNLILKHPDGELARSEIGSIRSYLLATEDAEAVIAKLAHPDTKVVTMTITEGGYEISDEPQPGPSVFGAVTEALDRRRHAGIAPFTIVSCDNIESNGEVASTAFTGFAARTDDRLASWIEANVAFPSSMVDRITPATTDDDRALVKDRWGITDLVPVTCEPFTQWVLEDSFTMGRPRLEDVGVQLVSDVRPYELMKLRLLNASHQALAYLGLLLGHTYAHEASNDPDLHALVRRFMVEEATPTLAPVPGVDLASYREMLFTRFGNESVADTLDRIGQFSTDRIHKFVLPVVRDAVANGAGTRFSAAIVAGWLRWLEMAGQAGEKVVDNFWHGQPVNDYAKSALGDLAETSFGDQVRDLLQTFRNGDVRTVISNLG